MLFNHTIFMLATFRRHDLNSFEVLKQCKSDFQAEIHEALLIKEHRSSLNKQLYAHGSSFLLNVYK